jgi:hypothetical protein
LDGLTKVKKKKKGHHQIVDRLNHS